MLSDLQCKNAKPKAKAYILTDGEGMYLEVSPTGGKLWRLKYRFGGKQKRLALGKYPDVPIVDARNKRQEARTLIAQGIDPSAKKRESKKIQVFEQGNTFEVVSKLWYEHKHGKEPTRYAQQTWARIQKDLFPELGKMMVTTITSRDIIHALKRVEARGVHELAYRLKQHCDEIFRYAVANGLAQNNPARSFENRDVLAKYEKRHFPAIEPKELPEFINALRSNKARLYRQTQLAVELLMLTFVRTSELIKARWDEFDLEQGEWLIPIVRMKMKRPHLVPLSKQVVTILRELHQLNGHREFVFPGVFNPRITMSNNTILQALTGMGYKGRMTGHGFRALAMTTLKEKLNYAHDVIDVQLAHAKKDKIQAAYDRAQFIEKRREMMQTWADYLDQLTNRKHDI